MKPSLKNIIVHQTATENLALPGFACQSTPVTAPVAAAAAADSAAVSLTPRHLQVHDRFHALRRQGRYPAHIIRTLAGELQISHFTVQHFLLTTAQCKPLLQEGK